MSYAGPAGQKNSGTPLKRPGPPRSTSSTERNLAFLTGVVFGATVGAGVALLLAPRSGRSTRRRLVSSGRRFTRRGRDAWHDAWHDLGDELHDARERRRERHETSRKARAAAAASAAKGGQRKSFSLRAASSL